MESIDRRALLVRTATSAAGLAAMGGARVAPAAARGFPSASAYGADVPAAWFDLALELVRTTSGFSPPVASRAFGYAGVTAFEAIAPGIRGRPSLAGRLNGLAPAPPPRDGAHHWPTVANSALAEVLRRLIPGEQNEAAIAELEERLAAPTRAGLPTGTFRRSVERGATVAAHVFAWSGSDGGHEGYRDNFPAYDPPVGPGLWVPTPPEFSPALQAYWGDNRPLLVPDVTTGAPEGPPPYSEEPGSVFHAEAMECYQAVADLTPEQEAIARFWSDDPGVTATPPGHSISILTQVLRALDVPLDRAAEAYAKVGIAVADAFICCWHTKYRHNLLRPVTYIQRLIDPAWTPPLATPPFPEYTSGHSVQMGAAARVLTDLFGPIPFTDHTHQARGMPSRSFGSFAEAADEAAISRLYGGIHFRAAIDRGLQQGDAIGRFASGLL